MSAILFGVLGVYRFAALLHSKIKILVLLGGPFFQPNTKKIFFLTIILPHGYVVKLNTKILISLSN